MRENIWKYISAVLILLLAVSSVAVALLEKHRCRFAVLAQAGKVVRWFKKKFTFGQAAEQKKFSGVRTCKIVRKFFALVKAFGNVLQCRAKFIRRIVTTQAEYRGAFEVIKYQ